MKTIKWGILGAGRIAGKFASDLRLVADAELVAIGSRSQASADEFAAKFPVKYRHDSYDALVKNPEVDVIYIATPHVLHYENTLLCLANNKAVLCEKPFAMNARQAKEMIALAREKKLFLMEALWTKFIPHFIKTKEMIGQGDLGEIRAVLANFGFKPTEPVPARLFDPALGGGTLMDIGIYNVFIALSILGKPDAIDAVMTPAATGVDEQCAVLFRYKSGAMAQLFSTFASNLATEVDICGTKGRIRLGTRFYDSSSTRYPSHRPSLSLKVFKPLSALIPAPVNTTIFFIDQFRVISIKFIMLNRVGFYVVSRIVNSGYFPDLVEHLYQ